MLRELLQNLVGLLIVGLWRGIENNDAIILHENLYRLPYIEVATNVSTVVYFTQ